MPPYVRDDVDAAGARGRHDGREHVFEVVAGEHRTVAIIGVIEEPLLARQCGAEVFLLSVLADTGTLLLSADMDGSGKAMCEVTSFGGLSRASLSRAGRGGCLGPRCLFPNESKDDRTQPAQSHCARPSVTEAGRCCYAFAMLPTQRQGRH
jgi:hypothetical protein